MAKKITTLTVDERVRIFEAHLRKHYDERVKALYAQVRELADQIYDQQYGELESKILRACKDIDIKKHLPIIRGLTLDTSTNRSHKNNTFAIRDVPRPNVSERGWCMECQRGWGGVPLDFRHYRIRFLEMQYGWTVNVHKLKGAAGRVYKALSEEHQKINAEITTWIDEIWFSVLLPMKSGPKLMELLPPLAEDIEKVLEAKNGIKEVVPVTAIKKARALLEGS